MRNADPRGQPDSARPDPTAKKRGPDAALALIDARPDLFARQGAVVATWQREGTPGPYYRLVYREAGRQRAVYLGRDGVGVDQVRRALAALREPRRRQRALRRMRRQVAAALRIHRAALQARLRPLGLRLHGAGIRGWRTTWLKIKP
jgi:hypothetical protein